MEQMIADLTLSGSFAIILADLKQIKTKILSTR